MRQQKAVGQQEAFGFSLFKIVISMVQIGIEQIQVLVNPQYLECVCIWRQSLKKYLS